MNWLHAIWVVWGESYYTLFPAIRAIAHLEDAPLSVWLRLSVCMCVYRRQQTVFTQSRALKLASFELWTGRLWSLLQSLDNIPTPYSRKQFTAMHLDRYVRTHILYINQSMSIVFKCTRAWTALEYRPNEALSNIQMNTIDIIHRYNQADQLNLTIHIKYMDQRGNLTVFTN